MLPNQLSLVPRNGAQSANTAEHNRRPTAVALPRTCIAFDSLQHATPTQENHTETTQQPQRTVDTGIRRRPPHDPQRFHVVAFALSYSTGADRSHAACGVSLRASFSPWRRIAKPQQAVASSAYLAAAPPGAKSRRWRRCICSALQPCNLLPDPGIALPAYQPCCWHTACRRASPTRPCWHSHQHAARGPLPSRGGSLPRKRPGLEPPSCPPADRPAADRARTYARVPSSPPVAVRPEHGTPSWTRP